MRKIDIKRKEKNLIKLISFLLTCRVNSQMANYRTAQHKNTHNIENKKDTYHTNKINNGESKSLMTPYNN
jgi:hypothetical protein